VTPGSVWSFAYSVPPESPGDHTFRAGGRKEHNDKYTRLYVSSVAISDADSGAELVTTLAMSTSMSVSQGQKRAEEPANKTEAVSMIVAKPKVGYANYTAREMGQTPWLNDQGVERKHEFVEVSDGTASSHYLAVHAAITKGGESMLRGGPHEHPWGFRRSSSRG
jgi:hypothetical protein